MKGVQVEGLSYAEQETQVRARTRDEDFNLGRQ